MEKSRVRLTATPLPQHPYCEMQHSCSPQLESPSSGDSCSFYTVHSPDFCTSVCFDIHGKRDMPFFMKTQLQLVDKVRERREESAPLSEVHGNRESTFILFEHNFCLDERQVRDTFVSFDISQPKSIPLTS